MKKEIIRFFKIICLIWGLCLLVIAFYGILKDAIIYIVDLLIYRVPKVIYIGTYSICTILAILIYYAELKEKRKK